MTSPSLPRIVAAAGLALAGTLASAAVPLNLPQIPAEAAGQVAEARAALRPGKQYRPEVPAPASVLGYEIGTWHTTHAAAQAYIHALAAAAPGRVKLVDYARSWEGRVLSYIVISSEDNIANLEARRAALAKLADPRGRSADELKAAVEGARPVVWLGATVHGDEHSGTEAVLALAYHLAACEDEEISTLRERTIVVIDPIQNPDGRERWVNWQTSAAMQHAGADGYGIEHDEPWPTGRYNHYLFDMNRDMIFLTQPETRGRARELAAWTPHIVADIHEFSGDSSYFFPPMNEPYNANIPESLRRLFIEIGQGNAAAFDERGYDYYVRDTFDFFFIGYGDVLPSMGGAAGMTFEQASTGGLVYRRDDGALLTLTAAAAHHFTAALASTRTAGRLGPDLLRSWLEYRKGAIEEGKGGPVRAYLISPDVNRSSVRSTVDRLSVMGVEMKRLDSSVTLRVRSYRSTGEAERRFPAGTIVIPLDQPLKRLIMSIFEKDAGLPESFVLEERQRKKDGLGTRFYDLSAWAVPYAYGLDAAWTGATIPAGSLSPLCPGVTAVTASTAGAAQVSGTGDAGWLDCLRRAGEGATPAPSIPPAKYGWLIRYDSNDSARALVALLEAGVKVRVAGEKFRQGSVDYERGTLLVRLKENEGRPDLREFLSRLARDNDLFVTGVDSSWTDSGASLGSDETTLVRRPRVAMLYGPPADATATGSTLYVLDRRYHLPVTPMHADAITGASLKNYDVLVLPEARREGDLDLGAIRSWVQAGGVLVALGDAAALVSTPEAKLTTARFVDDLRTLDISLEESGPASATATGIVAAAPASSGPPAGAKPVARPSPSEPPRQDAAAELKPEPAPAAGASGEGDKDKKAVPLEARPETIPGSIFKVTLDQTTYLTYGYGREAEVLVFSSRVLRASEDGMNAVTFAKDKPLVSGFAWQKMQRALAGRQYLVKDNLGAGQVILFSEDPLFRAWWESLDRLLLNAVLFGPSRSR